MKKFLSVLVCVLCMVALVACGGGGATDGGTSDGGTSNGGNVLSGIGDKIGEMLSGDTTGSIGKAYHTQWFAFRVDSIDRVNEYAGYSAAEGKELIDVTVTVRNIFGEEIPMGTYDFYLDSDTFLDYEWPMNPMDATMMPEEYDLADGEERTYHMLYEVPAGLDDLVLYYTEWDDEGTMGDTFSVAVPQ